MTIFPKNNLPTASLNWGREVEKSINNLESSFRTAEVNNVSRDAQLQASYKRLDTAVTQLAATNAAVDQAQSDSIAALQAAQTATTTATTANTNALNALQDIIELGSPGGPTINANNITAGTLTGVTVQTGSSGTRVKASGTNIEFYSNAYTNGADRVGYIQGDDGGNAGLYMISDQGEIGLDAVNITLSGDTTVTGGLSVGDFLEVNGAFSPGSISTGAINATTIDATGGIGSASLSTGNISGTSMTINGGTANLQSGAVVNGGLTVSSGSSNLNSGMSTTWITASSDLNLTGRILGSTGTYNATTTSTANVFVASNGNFARSTSSRRYKSDIQDVDYGLTALQLQPRTWVDKSEYEANGNSTEGLERIPGFIAEELHDLGLTELVQYNENGEPDAVYYDRMLVAVIPVIKAQQVIIETLEARLAALEDKVQ